MCCNLDLTNGLNLHSFVHVVFPRSNQEVRPSFWRSVEKYELALFCPSPVYIGQHFNIENSLRSLRSQIWDLAKVLSRYVKKYEFPLLCRTPVFPNNIGVKIALEIVYCVSPVKFRSWESFAKICYKVWISIILRLKGLKVIDKFNSIILFNPRIGQNWVSYIVDGRSPIKLGSCAKFWRNMLKVWICIILSSLHIYRSKWYLT